VNCKWMYIDGSKNLWFGIDGGIDIISDEVNQWEDVYKYDKSRNSFILIIKGGKKCRFVSMYQSYLIYSEDNFLKAFDTRKGSIKNIDKITGELVHIMDSQNDIYYQDSDGRYILLSNLGGQGQTKTVLNLKNFPNGRFSYSEYIIDEENQILLKFQRTGYEKVCDLDDSYNWTFADGGAPSTFDTENGLYFLNCIGAYIDYFDIRTKLWATYGDEYQETLSWPYFADGQIWFTSWKPIALCSIIDGKYEKYDLSTVICECNWVGFYNNVVFVNDNWYDNDFSAVFFTDTKEYYIVDPFSLPVQDEGA
jgi:hypothetical protein